MNIFSTNPGEITDFKNMSFGDIFNNTVVSILDDLDANAARIDQELGIGLDALNAESQETASLLEALPPRASVVAEEEAVDYNAPLPMSEKNEGGFKLSNYGYASDSSPDYNSNVRRVGHAENPLEDGVSAALTKSLAKRYGLKTGDMFEITTADGKTMQRRYDDTVPRTYRGKPLPETVDLYEIGGSNKFGGKVINLKKL